MGDVGKDILGIGSVIAAPFTAGTSLAWLPAVLGAGSSIVGAVGAGQQQQQGQNAYNAATGNQNSILSNIVGSIVPQQENYANELGNDYSFINPLIDALTGGVNTIKSQIGGVANPGALISQLFGQNLTSALSGAASGKANRIAGASNILGGVTNSLTGASSGYGQLASRAAGAAGAAGSQYPGLINNLTASLSPLGTNPGGSGTSTIPYGGGDPSTLSPIPITGVGTTTPTGPGPGDLGGLQPPGG